MRQLMLIDDSLDEPRVKCRDLSNEIRAFDRRRRCFETDDAYYTRLRTIEQAFQTDYYSTKWAPFTDWAEICPKGPGDRLPKARDRLGNEAWFHLAIRDVSPEDWEVPANLKSQPSKSLPARATYIPKKGDVLLSRFKEPLGKCVIYLGLPQRLVVSSNFVLLRPRNHIDPVLLLSVVKSSFLACQLHYIIRKRAVITEMFVKEVPQLVVPAMSQGEQDSLTRWGTTMLEVSAVLRKINSVSDGLHFADQGLIDAHRSLSEAATAIDTIIKEFVES